MDISIFGKLPSQGDYYRYGSQGGVFHEAERWVLESYESLRGQGFELPSSAINIILSNPAWSEIVVGVIMGSRDSVGRTSPLVAFTRVSSSFVARRGWMVPILYTRFFQDLQRLLWKAVADGNTQALQAGVDQIPNVDPSLFAHSDNIFAKFVNSQTVEAFESRVFSRDGERFYAYRTLRMACEQARSGGTDQPATVLACPIGVETDVIVWSALITHVLGWPDVLPMTWIQQHCPHMLVSFGALPKGAFRFLLTCDTNSTHYWPLTTDRQNAIELARQDLEAASSWNNAGEPLSGLFERVARLG